MSVTLKGFDDAIKRKGVTISAVVEQLGTDASAFYRKRMGERRFSLNDVVKLAGILDCSIQDLVYGFDVNPPDRQDDWVMGLGHMQKDLCKHLISNEIEASLDVTRDGPASTKTGPGGRP